MAGSRTSTITLALAFRVTVAVPVVAAHDVVATAPAARTRERASKPRFMEMFSLRFGDRVLREDGGKRVEPRCPPRDRAYASLRTGVRRCKRLARNWTAQAGPDDLLNSQGI